MSQPGSSARDEFVTAMAVSRETLERLEQFVALLNKWQRRINLVAASTLAEIWRRHILDSAQLVLHFPARVGVLTDLGSGAGFPGMILAILRSCETHLVEADQRKCAFLHEAARICAPGVQIHEGRAEALAPWPSDIVTARAVAPLETLIGLATPFLRPNHGACLFLKGAGAERELTAAHKRWNMAIESHASLSNPEGVVLKISHIRRVQPASDHR